MARRLRPRWRISLAAVCVAVMAIVMLAGALKWYRPFLTRATQPVASAPAPTALFQVTEFRVPAHQQACMSSVSVTPQSDRAFFLLRPPSPTPKGGPPVLFTLTAPSYRASLAVPGGYPGGSVDLPVAPPRAPVIATACFFNRGPGPVVFDGTTEDRTVSRAAVTINGRPKHGDIALIFYDSRPQSVLDRLGGIFTHASNLTDGLVPVWLVWLFAVLTALGVPAAIIFAFYRAIAEDPAAAA